MDLSVEVLFVAPNTTSFIQLMDQGVISHFRAYYMQGYFDNCMVKNPLEIFGKL